MAGGVGVVVMGVLDGHRCWPACTCRAEGEVKSDPCAAAGAVDLLLSPCFSQCVMKTVLRA